MKLKEQEQELVHLAGHNNLKQKIHYVHTMKLENSQLKEVCITGSLTLNHLSPHYALKHHFTSL